MLRFSLQRVAPLALLAFLIAACSGSGEVVETQSPIPPPPDTTMTSSAPATVSREAPDMQPQQVWGVDLDTVQAGPFDQGKMWTFENPPLEYLEETYGFTPDEAWFEDARRSALRIPGCSASFVSQDGLVLTNHHCGRNHVADVSEPGENLLDNGFTARSLDEERAAPNMHADQLIALRDVTAQVESAIEEGQTGAERAQARQAAMEAVEAELKEEFGGDEENIFVQVVSLYNGGIYSAYIFHRYTDVRLVMAPELDLGYYGGDTDNFTYPRYALDMTLFRVYDDGEPLRTENFFEWTDDGAQENDLVFVIGNPGSTSRLETVAQLEYRRDVQEPGILNLAISRADAMREFIDENPDVENIDAIRNRIFGLRNVEKLYGGRVEALQDPYIMARRMDTEDQFETALEADMELQAEYGGLIQEMADLQEQKREYSEAFKAFISLQPGSPYASATLQRAIIAHMYLTRQEQGAGDAMLERILGQLANVPTQPEGLDRRLLEVRFRDFAEFFGADDEVTEDVLEGRSPEMAARELVSESVLADSASALEAIESGSITMSDPAVDAVDGFISRYRAYQSATAGLGQQQQEVAAKLGRARYEVYGTAVPPDATFSLRISDGIVKGYEYNGTWAPWHTTYFGLYDHYYSYGQDSEWDLPERWVPAPAELDLSTPVNLVSTNDIIGGNSGSPLISEDQKLVGLIFDGNIESLKSDYIYLSQSTRAVSVDARGMIEALDAVYDLDRIVQELRTTEVVETEAEADAM